MAINMWYFFFLFQYFTGSCTIIPQTGEKNCPVKVFRYCFRFFRFTFGGNGRAKKFLNGRFYRDSGRTLIINNSVLSRSNSTADMRQLIRASGEFERKFTEKSFKCGGVSFMFNKAHATQHQVQVHGRWRNPQTPLFYRDDSDEYRLELAKKMIPKK